MDTGRNRLTGVEQDQELRKSQTGIFYDDQGIITGRYFFVDDDGTGVDFRQIFRIRIDGKGNIVLTCFFQAFYVTNDGLTVADDRPAQQCC